ncbi:hypothetical protein ACFVH6_21555 [Spirillospora sp. NPDC127200]
MTPEVERLAELAVALGARGLVCSPRYQETPPVLRVWNPEVPIVGESISAVIGPLPPDGKTPWWYRCSCKHLIAGCDDPTQAATLIFDHLEHYIKGAKRVRA